MRHRDAAQAVMNLFAVLELLGRFDGRQRAYVDVILQSALLSVMSPPVAEDRGAGKLVEPDRKPVTVPQGLDSLEDPQPGLLKHVPGIFLGTDETADVVEEPLLPLADQLVEGLALPALAAQNQ